MGDLKRKIPSALDEHTMEERIHNERVNLMNSKFPRLDALMCSVLLKCPPELLDELISKPEMWKTAEQTTTVLSSNITVTDPDPEPPSQENTPPSSPRSVLEI